jgi:hypothetical protein
VPVYLCPSTERVDEHRTPEGQLINLGGVPGEGLACIDYLGVSGPNKDTLHPATGEEYGRQRGILLGTKGLPDGNLLTEPPVVTPAKVTDGLSKTICMVECTGRGVSTKDGVVENLDGAWASGSNISHINKGVNEVEPPKAWENERIFAEHPGGAHALVCDGSVQFISDATAELVIMYLCSRDGDELITEMPY